MEFAKWRAWRGLRGHVLACSINWACVGTWRALKNGVPGVLHKIECLTCFINDELGVLKIDEMFF